MLTTDNRNLPNLPDVPNTPPLLDVILPAGGRITGEFAQMAGTEIKALIDLDGETILRRAISTLRAAGRIGRIAVIGSEAVLAEAKACSADILLPEGESGPDNILRGLAALEEEKKKRRKEEEKRQGTGNREQGTEEKSLSTINYQLSTTSKVLILTTDLPFLTADALNVFLQACPPDADIALPIMTEAEFTSRFPGTQNEYARLRDGGYTLGCAFVVDGAALLRNEAHLRALFDARKSQWQMARLIGFGTILKFVTRRLTVEDLEAKASAIAGCRGIAIRHMPPELAYDIDLPAEYEYARRHIAAIAQHTTVTPVAGAAQEMPR